MTGGRVARHREAAVAFTMADDGDRPVRFAQFPRLKAAVDRLTRLPGAMQRFFALVDPAMGKPASRAGSPRETADPCRA